MNRKKFITLWIAAALLSSCSSDWEPDMQPCEQQPIRLTAVATAVPGQTRAASTDDLQNTAFAAGEDVAVYMVDCDGTATYTATPYRYRTSAAVSGQNELTYYSDATTASLLCYPIDAASNVDVYAFYPYSRFASVSNRETTDLDVTVSNDQSTVANYRASDVMIATPVTDHSRYPKDDNTINLQFRHVMARLVIRLKQGVHAGSSSPITATELAGTTITIGNIATEATMNMTTGAVTAGDNAATVTVASNADLAFYYDNADAAIGTTEYAIVLPAQALSSTNTITITTGDGETITGTLPDIDLTAGSSTVLTITVNDSGIEATRTNYSATSGQKWEKIPEGALSGQFSVSGSTMVYFSKGNLQYVGTWQFATNQWDYFGNSQSDDHRDLFGWGTGNNPNEISEDNSIYSSYNEWGANAITNGGNTANKWRTLTRNEWQYLLFSRTTTTNLATSNARFAKAYVNSKYGLIIFPNHYIHPSDVTVPSYINDASSGFGTNYNTTNWAKMEAAGAAFIPNAGYRTGSTFTSVANIGYYWSATSGSSNSSANILFISASKLITNVGADRYSGRPVRLVQNVQ
ncbi:MAG: fimbrillin family protein [Bacteroidaceae bacterium]|nr:fimbrillin family protein [Bacteroidaceae bacterium]MBR4897233.1 fimbrillin family protein [Prevotella sp.]